MAGSEHESEDWELCGPSVPDIVETRTPQQSFAEASEADVDTVEDPAEQGITHVITRKWSNVMTALSLGGSAPADSEPATPPPPPSVEEEIPDAHPIEGEPEPEPEPTGARKLWTRVRSHGASARRFIAKHSRIAARVAATKSKHGALAAWNHGRASSKAAAEGARRGARAATVHARPVAHDIKGFVRTHEQAVRHVAIGVVAFGTGFFLRGGARGAAAPKKAQARAAHRALALGAMAPVGHDVGHGCNSTLVNAATLGGAAATGAVAGLAVAGPAAALVGAAVRGSTVAAGAAGGAYAASHSSDQAGDVARRAGDAAREWIAKASAPGAATTAVSAAKTKWCSFTRQLGVTN